MTTQRRHISVGYSLTAIYAGQIGSVVKPVDGNGVEVFKAPYEAKGKQTITNSTFVFNRDCTMREHLPEFNPVNMNGRVYDPLTAMFFSPDPYLQAPENWLNYNRYGYCLNNPFLYTDPDGEWIHIVVGAVIGGVINWAAHGAQFSGEGLAAFGIGAAGGAVTAATGGAALGTFGAAAGAGGFIGGAVAGGIAYTHGTVVTSIGNNVLFGDLMPTVEQVDVILL